MLYKNFKKYYNKEKGCDNVEQLFNLVVQNGIGVGSFIALLYFMDISLKDIKSNTEEITKTLILIQGNLTSLTQRVEIMENKVNETK